MVRLHAIASPVEASSTQATNRTSETFEGSSEESFEMAIRRAVQRAAEANPEIRRVRLVSQHASPRPAERCHVVVEVA